MNCTKTGGRADRPRENRGDAGTHHPGSAVNLWSSRSKPLGAAVLVLGRYGDGLHQSTALGLGYR